MTVAVSRDITRGLTTLDSLRVRVPKRGTAARKTTGRFVCIPYHYSSKLITSSNSSAIHVTPGAQWDSPRFYKPPHVYPVLAGERVYDLGWRENWRRLLRQPLFDNDIQHRGRVVSDALYSKFLAEDPQCIQVAKDEPINDSSHVEF